MTTLNAPTNKPQGSLTFKALPEVLYFLDTSCGDQCLKKPRQTCNHLANVMHKIVSIHMANYFVNVYITMFFGTVIIFYIISFTFSLNNEILCIILLIV